MSIVELLAAVGPENIIFQRLHESITRIDFGGKKGITVTFGTDQITQYEMLTEDFTKVGIVVWFNKKLVPEELKGKL